MKVSSGWGHSVVTRTKLIHPIHEAGSVVQLEPRLVVIDTGEWYTASKGPSEMVIASDSHLSSYNYALQLLKHIQQPARAPPYTCTGLNTRLSGHYRRLFAYSYHAFPRN